MAVPSNAAQILKDSAKPLELARAAQELAVSGRAEDHRTLLSYLKSAAFREKLDPADDTSQRSEDTWMARPLRSLQGNGAASARAALTELMADAEFTASVLRVELLVTASAFVRPPGPAVIAFWRRFSAPQYTHLGAIVWALLDNGDPAAVAEFEKLLLATAPHPDDLPDDPRVRWLRRPFLAHRDNVHVLAMAQRLLARPQPPLWIAPLQISMAEALFLRLAEWYRPHQEVSAPPRVRTPAEGRVILRQIAEQVGRDFQVSPLLEGGIRATLAELSAMGS